jgi:hypothetical protein
MTCPQRRRHLSLRQSKAYGYFPAVFHVVGNVPFGLRRLNLLSGTLSFRRRRLLYVLVTLPLGVGKLSSPSRKFPHSLSNVPLGVRKLVCNTRIGHLVRSS